MGSKSVWGPQHRQGLFHLRTYIHQLRQKFEDDPSKPKYLLIDHNVGYRFVEPTQNWRLQAPAIPGFM